MDDMKRAVYMRARELIAGGEALCVCKALQKAVGDVFGYRVEDVDLSFSNFTLFHEFVELFDGKRWVYYSDGGVAWVPSRSWSRERWWDIAARGKGCGYYTMGAARKRANTARLALLDYLLGD